MAFYKNNKDGTRSRISANQLLVDNPRAVEALNDLSDVSLDTPSLGDVLVFDGEKWGNAVFDGFEREKLYTPIELTYDEGKYIRIDTGAILSHASYHMAEVSFYSNREFLKESIIY